MLKTPLGKKDFPVSLMNSTSLYNIKYILIMNALGSDSPTRPSLTVADNVDDWSVPPRLKGKLYPSRTQFTGQVKSFFLPR